MTVIELKEMVNQIDSNLDNYEVFNGQVNPETNQLVKANAIISTWFDTTNSQFVFLDNLSQ
jgi:hypothetical protein